MLKQLTVRNFALVESLDIEFGPGLTVITGESGAGKSILLHALDLVLGARADRTTVRPGASSTEVTAEFHLDGRDEAREYIAERALEDDTEPHHCLVRRVGTAAGRSRAFINGTPVNVSALQALCAPLVDVYAQNQHRSLLERSTQLKLLDDFGVPSDITDTVRVCHADWQAQRSELQELEQRTRSTRERMDLLRYQLDELGVLAVDEGEVEALTQRHKRLSSATDIQFVVGTHAETLDEQLLSQLSRIHADLEDIDDDHSALKAARQHMEAGRIEAEEGLSALRAYFEAVPVDPEALKEVEERLEAIHDAARKHRVSAMQLAAHTKEVAAELQSLEVDESRVRELRETCEAREQKYRDAAANLSEARAVAARRFEKAVTSALAELGFGQAALSIEFTPAENERGLETVDFLFTASPRFPPGLLGAIASGGELARISLAVCVVAAASSDLPCLVLDEADVGIGGTTADVLGRMLRRLAKHTQVICVTHAPQVAALGDAHLRVTKTSTDDTVIEVLDDLERVDELARMLAGQQITSETRAYAQTLLAGGQPS
ncbi:MAG: DNA repair protein RecN [Gammaproteobacteria bacterium]|nr:DNA repair protein RecN [Gammaproteobacteria bacterium]MDE0225659.1 DNA repair protein RecN [Gammaproteobacteria bacterium]